MRPTFDRRLWILLYIQLIQCIVITNQQNIIKPQNTNLHQHNSNNNNQNHNPPAAAGGIASHNGNSISTVPAAAAAAAAWSISAQHQPLHQQHQQQFASSGESSRRESFSLPPDDNKSPAHVRQQNLKLPQQQQQTQKCAKNCSKLHATTINYNKNNNNNNNKIKTNSATSAASGATTFTSLRQTDTSPLSLSLLSSAAHSTTTTNNYNNRNTTTTTNNKKATKSNSNNNKQPSQLPSTIDAHRSHANVNPAKLRKAAQAASPPRPHHAAEHSPKVHTAHRSQHKEVKWHREAFWRAHESHKPFKWEGVRSSVADGGAKRRTRRNTSADVASESLDNADSEALRAEELLRVSAARAKLDGATAVVVLSTSDSVSSSSAVASSFSAATTAEVSESESTQEQQTFKTAQLVKAASNAETASAAASSLEDFSFPLPSEQPEDASPNGYYRNDSANLRLTAKPKRARSTVSVSLPADGMLHKPKEPIIIIDDVEEFDSGTDRERNLAAIALGDDKSEDYSHDEPLEPRVLPLRPVLPNPYEDEEMSVVYAEQHSEIRLMCEVDLDIATSMWYKNGQVVHAMDRTSRATDYRFIKEPNGALTITNVMLEDDGKWQCEAENMRRYTENARPVKLVVLDRPKPPYLLIDSRRLDAGNIFVPVKENSELNLACVSEGGNPKPTLTWEVLLSPGVDRHAQKVSAEVLELEEVKNDKDKNTYKINGGAKSEARLPAVYRAHHNARILCVMEHPTLKIRQNASLLLDVQYTPSFAISRTPGFGYPLREGIEVSLKCDVDSNPPSTPRWQKDDGDTPVPQTGDGFLNFTSIRREHSGWYKCTSRHLNFQYSSIGYYLSVRYDSVDVTSEPDDQDISVAAASHNPNKGQLEVQLGGAVTLQCPQGSLGCWSHLDPVTARLRGLGYGLTTPTGQFSLKDVVYQDAGTYKCIGQSLTNKKKLEVLQTVGVTVKGAPTVVARNATPVAYPGSPLHLAVEFCANPPAYAARWLHGDRVFTPGNQYGSTVLAYGVTDLPTPYCKEARLTYVSMHERVPRTFYFIVSSPGGVAEAVFKVNFTMRYRAASNAVDDEEEELSEPEEIHFPVFGANQANRARQHWSCWLWLLLWLVVGACPLRRGV